MAGASHPETSPLEGPGCPQAHRSTPDSLPPPFPPGKGQGAAGAATLGQGRAASWRPSGLELFQSRRGTENCGNVLRAGQSGPGPGGRGLLQEAQAHGVLGGGEELKGTPQPPSKVAEGPGTGRVGVTVRSWQVVQRELAGAVGGWGGGGSASPEGIGTRRSRIYPPDGGKARRMRVGVVRGPGAGAPR